jgi:hypothetical protein
MITRLSYHETVVLHVRSNGDDIMNIPIKVGENITLLFMHSIYKGQVFVKYKVTENGFIPLEIASKDEASISYYTDNYTFNGTMFIAQLKGVTFNEILINDGWELIINNQIYVLPSNRIVELNVVN